MSPSAAFAAGERQEAEDIYRVWARARQTRPKPLPLQKFVHVLIGIVVFLLLGSMIIVAVTHLVNKPYIAAREYALYLFVAVIAFLTMILLLYIQRAITPSYAVIIPLSLKEHRESRSNQMYPRRSWIVAIVSALIAALAVAAAVWIKVTSK